MPTCHMVAVEETLLSCQDLRPSRFFCMMISFPKEEERGMAEAVARQVGFLGAGRMATALAKGWLKAGLIAIEGCRASDPLPQARQAFT